MENNKEYQGWIEAIQERGWTLQFVPEEHRTEEMCLVAVKQDGLNLRDVPDDLITQELCEMAVKDYAPALCWVPDELKTLELCELALSHGNLSEELLNSSFVPEEFKEELAEKYDLYLEPKAKGR